MYSEATVTRISLCTSAHYRKAFAAVYSLSPDWWPYVIYTSSSAPSDLHKKKRERAAPTPIWTMVMQTTADVLMLLCDATCVSCSQKEEQVLWLYTWMKPQSASWGDCCKTSQWALCLHGRQYLTHHKVHLYFAKILISVVCTKVWKWHRTAVTPRHTLTDTIRKTIKYTGSWGRAQSESTPPPLALLASSHSQLPVCGGCLGTNGTKRCLLKLLSAFSHFCISMTVTCARHSRAFNSIFVAVTEQRGTPVNKHVPNLQ